MKETIHPEYQDVLFIDTATGKKFVCGSTLKPTETAEFEGKDYPVYKASITSDSHPFFTGGGQVVDSEGRIEKFKKRYAAKQKEEPKEEIAPKKKVVKKKKV
ncbi:MAG: type B 50S ribosomal protein L31 [Simkaniaceae bacterium]